MRSIALWMLGHPEAALADADRAVKNARAIGHAVSLMFALAHAELTHTLCGNYAAGSECLRELAALADEKGSLFWKTVALLDRGYAFGSDWRPGKSTSYDDLCAKCFRSNRSKVPSTLHLSVLASTYAALGKFDDARRCIGEAMNTMETNKERWFEVDVNRIAGEVELKFPEPDTAKAKRISSVRSRSHVNSKRNPGNSAPQ